MEAELVDGEREVASAAVIDPATTSACSAYDCGFVALANSVGHAPVAEDARIMRAFPETSIVMNDFLAGQ